MSQAGVVEGGAGGDQARRVEEAQVQLVRCALFLAWLSAGSNRAARMAIMAMTTSNSIRVNARLV